ncbi:MAG: DUF6864 domain-containing function [Thermodesulfobacteriota bacterium]
MHIKSGPLSLRAGGTAIQFEDEDVTLSFQLPMSDRSVFDIDVTFVFREDSGRDSGYELVNPLEGMSPDDIGGSARYELTIYNSSFPDGVSNESPILLGEYAGIGLYLNFKAEGHSSASQKILQYSFYTS